MWLSLSSWVALRVYSPSGVTKVGTNSFFTLLGLLFCPLSGLPLNLSLQGQSTDSQATSLQFFLQDLPPEPPVLSEVPSKLSGAQGLTEQGW